MLEARARIVALAHPLLEHGLGRLPEIELGVELPAQAFDREQRLLQQHELRLHFHVELARRLKQAQQHEPERDVLQRLVEDRLADRAHGGLELVDARTGRHPARIDVQGRDAPVIAAEEREKILGEIVLIALVERADDAEVDGDVLRLLRVW